MTCGGGTYEPHSAHPPLAQRARRAGPELLAACRPSSVNWGEGSPSADMCSAVGWVSFRRLVDIPFDACLAALECSQRAGQDSELHVGQSLLRWPIEADRDSGTCRIQARLARGPLRRPLLMRLEIDRWSSCGRPRPRTCPRPGSCRSPPRWT